MHLWIHWWNAIWRPRPACSRPRAFLWFATRVAGLTVRTDLLGVTSIVRALGLPARFYYLLLHHFHGVGVDLDAMSAPWGRVGARLFPHPPRVNGRLMMVGDGIKIPKCGKKMPAVKPPRQESESNTQPEYIMGHSPRAVSLLVPAANSVFAVPLAIRIHEGLGWSNRDQRTLLDKMIALLTIVDRQEPFYFVADAYHASHKIINGLLAHDNHRVTRVKSNAVAYPVFDRQEASDEAGHDSTATKGSSGHCSARGRRWSRPSVLSTARKKSPSSTGSVICRGGPLDGWRASWWSFIPPEAAAC